MDRKHCGEKEKLLVTSNFSFSHRVFKRLVSQGHQKVSLCESGLTKLEAFEDDKKLKLMGRFLSFIVWEKEKMLFTTIFSNSFNLCLRVNFQLFTKTMEFPAG